MKILDQIEGFDIDTIKYHQALVVEANLVDGLSKFNLDNNTEIPSVVFLKKLTWEGHEFIDAVRSASVWNTIKSEFKESTLETVVKVSKQLAEGWAKKKVEALLDESS